MIVLTRSASWRYSITGRLAIPRGVAVFDKLRLLADALVGRGLDASFD